MKFVPTDELKSGMRLAKPIYNKTGVMLYDRDSKLTTQGIASVKNFGLIGIYILEPAEPVPPMTEEDREFERFQAVSVFSIKEILDQIVNGKSPKKLETLVSEILLTFGRFNGRMNFFQNLRSPEDTVYKHSLNVAILAVAIAGKMNMKNEILHKIAISALLHDVGSLDIPDEIKVKKVGDLTEEDRKVIYKCRDDGYKMIRENCDFDSDILKNISYLIRDMSSGEKVLAPKSKVKDLQLDILKVAYMYDNLTAMKFGEEPKSDISTYRMLKHPMSGMNQEVIKALTKAINIAPPGCTVEFANGSKGIVLTENEDDILRPFILSFDDNQIYNLSIGQVYEQFQIKDTIKTLDNRYMMVDEYKDYLGKLGNGEVK